MTPTVWEHLLEMQTPSLATPGDVARIIDPRTVTTPALDLIDRHLINLLHTHDGRLIITMPPQEGKSTRVARDFPVWALTQDPDLRIVTGSYAQSLANRNGRAVRNAVANTPQLGLSIATDNGAASEWSVADHHGGLISVGRGAGITGRPADLIIIDDPVKDRAEAESEIVRDTCWDWYTDALASRLSPGASIALIMTRWHEDDLVGRLTTMDHGAPWIVINIPAQCDTTPDPLGRQPGEYMVSARGRTTRDWERRKATAGPRAWAALYQGHPSPPDGNIFHRDWWQHWRQEPPLDGRIIQSWDLSFKGTASSDYVVGQVWLLHQTGLYLLDQVRGRWGFTETCAQITALTQRWPITQATLIEDKANGPAVIDQLRRTMMGIIPIEPQGGKEARANAVSPLVQAGNVFLPDPLIHPWVTELVEEATSFPNGTHDDQVDALTQAITWLAVTTPTRNYGSGFYNIG